jgi:hypothetical protein
MFRLSDLVVATDLFFTLATVILSRTRNSRRKSASNNPKFISSRVLAGLGRRFVACDFRCKKALTLKDTRVRAVWRSVAQIDADCEIKGHI